MKLFTAKALHDITPNFCIRSRSTSICLLLEQQDNYKDDPISQVYIKDALSCFMNSLNYNGNLIENRVNSRNMRGHP
jgi:hypothetical protein